MSIKKPEIFFKRIKSNAKDRYDNEKNIFEKLGNGSDYVIKYYGEENSQNGQFLKIEYCDGDLSKLKRVFNYAHKTIPEKIVRIIVIQIFTGLKYIYDKNIIHDDIKLANIGVKLLNCSFENNFSNNFNFSELDEKNSINYLKYLEEIEKEFIEGKAKCKIIDFDLSKEINVTDITFLVNFELKFIYEDTYNIGKIMYYLLTLNEENFDKSKKEEFILSEHLNLSKSCVLFLTSLLKINPKARPSLEQALKNDFIVNEQKEKFDYDTIKEKYLRTNKEGQRELILPLKYYSVNFVKNQNKICDVLDYLIEI